jgi:hypothetical protein
VAGCLLCALLLTLLHLSPKTSSSNPLCKQAAASGKQHINKGSQKAAFSAVAYSTNVGESFAALFSSSSVMHLAVRVWQVHMG